MSVPCTMVSVCAYTCAELRDAEQHRREDEGQDEQPSLSSHRQLAPFPLD